MSKFLTKLLLVMAVVFAMAMIGGTAQSVASASSTAKIKLQIKDAQQAAWHSRGIVRWYKTKGRWALRPGYEKCWDQPSIDWVPVCTKARYLLREHSRRLPRLLAWIEELKFLLQPVGNVSNWNCIERFERNPAQGWATNTGNGFFGGLQMNRAFMATYGADMVRKYGGVIRDGKAYGGEAHLWTPREQMVVAERGRHVQGWHAWPNTARMCGLI